MKINTKIFETLELVAHTSTHPKVWVSSALVYRNKIISIGVNQMKSHPFQKKFSKNSDAIYFHAETAAIHTAEKKFQFNKFESAQLYIYRFKYDSSKKIKLIDGLAAPCSGCLKCIKNYGIKNIIYSLDNIDNNTKKYGIMLL